MTSELTQAIFDVVLLDTLRRGHLDRAYSDETAVLPDKAYHAMIDSLTKDQKEAIIEETDAARQEQRRALAQKRHPWNLSMDAIHARIEERLREVYGDDRKRGVYFSAYTMAKGSDIPQDNLDDVAAEGTVRLSYWSDAEEPSVSEPMTDPTWLDVAVWFDQAMADQRDMHHQFLEGLHNSRDTDDDVRVVCAGS